MPVLFVARSVKLGRWGSDVGQGKHVYKVGLADGDPKALAAAGWAGESDWKIVKSREVEGLTEEEALARLARKERMLDPNLYPKLKGTQGRVPAARRAGREPHPRHARLGRRQRPHRTEIEAGRFRRLSHSQRDAVINENASSTVAEGRGNSPLDLRCLRPDLARSP